MKHNIGTSPVDADRSRRQADQLGTTDGTKNYPPYSPGAEPAPDYRREAFHHEAETTDALTRAGHLVEQRRDDDDKVAKETTRTAALTSDTRDRRLAVSNSRQRLAGFIDALPYNALTVPLPKWAAWVILLGLGLATGGATTAALMSATAETQSLSWVIGAGIALATVMGAAGVGRLLRERDLSDMKGDHFAAVTRRGTAVILAGILGLACVAFGVAELRSAASRSDAVRQARAGQITTFGTAPAPTARSAAPSIRSVGWWVWLFFETGLITAAVSIEYVTSNARTEEKERREVEVSDTEDDYSASKRELSDHAGGLMTALSSRADRDASVHLLGSAHREWAHTQTAVYRGSNLATRGQAGDPFAKNLPGPAAPGTPPAPGTPAAVTPAAIAVLIDFIGRDLHLLPRPAVPVADEVAEDKPAEQEDPADPLVVLRAAMAELGQAPEQPKLEAPARAHTPGEETVLDPMAQAKAKALRDAQAAGGKAETESSAPEAAEPAPVSGGEATTESPAPEAAEPAPLPSTTVPTNGKDPVLS